MNNRYNITHDEIQQIINRRNGVNDESNQTIQIYDNVTNMNFNITQEELRYIRQSRAQNHFSDIYDQPSNSQAQPRAFLNIGGLPPPATRRTPATLRRTTRINPDDIQRLNVSENYNSKYEEDSTDNDTFTSDKESLKSNESVKDCINDNLITLESYNQYDDPIMIYVLNSNNKFEKAICITQDEFNNYIQSDLREEIPSNIMSIATTPRNYDISGIGSHPTKNIVVKMPINQLYITLGSAIRINKEYINNKIWYALPMYNKKRRRITNIKGLVGSSMNHGQVPGFIIYKLLRRDQIQKNMEIKETDDYPRYSDNEMLDKRDIEKIIDILL